MLLRNNQQVGKLFLIIGAIVFVCGLLILLKPKVPILKHLGSLPGDIYLKKGSFYFYFPFTTGIILSLILSLIVRLMIKK